MVFEISYSIATYQFLVTSWLKTYNYHETIQQVGSGNFHNTYVPVLFFVKIAKD